MLYIVPIHPGPSRDFLAPLAAKLAEVFGLPTALRSHSFDPELAFDASRGQYNSRLLLAQLLHDKPQDTTRILGVTGVDLFIPVLTHVFGEAQLDGPAAVVSAYRLDNQIYGLPPNRDLLLKRLCKEAIHELGHTYHLVHCRAAVRHDEFHLRRGHRPEVGSLLHGLPQPCTEQRSVILSAAKNLASLAIQARFFAALRMTVWRVASAASASRTAAALYGVRLKNG